MLDYASSDQVKIVTVNRARIENNEGVEEKDVEDVIQVEWHRRIYSCNTFKGKGTITSHYLRSQGRAKRSRVWITVEGSVTLISQSGVETILE